MWELAISDMKIYYEIIEMKTIWSYHSSRQDISQRTNGISQRWHLLISGETS